MEKYLGTADVPECLSKSEFKSTFGIIIQIESLQLRYSLLTCMTSCRNMPIRVLLHGESLPPMSRIQVHSLRIVKRQTIGMVTLYMALWLPEYHHFYFGFNMIYLHEVYILDRMDIYAFVRGTSTTPMLSPAPTPAL